MNSGPILSIGSAGPDVRRLQIIFVMTKVLNVSDIDSQFGPKTHRTQSNHSNKETILRRMGWWDR